MKPLLKILTPTISTIGMGSISLASCGTTSVDGYTAIPRQYLNIEGTTLDGLTDEGKYPGPAKQYDKVTVPKEITTVKGFNFESEGTTPGYTNIKKVDFEVDSKCTTINAGCFTTLPNLLVVVLPSKLNSIGEHSILKCQKINTIDISSVEDISCLTSIEWIEYDGTLEYPSGTLIIRKDQTSKIVDIKSKNHCLNKFEVKEK